jgi:hypothetical protein
MNFTKKALLVLATASIVSTNVHAAAGDLYALDYTNHTLVRITPAGSQTLIASLPDSAFHIAVDATGVVYVSLITGEIKKITNGVVTSFATDVGTASDLAFRSGSLFVTNGTAGTVVRIEPNGTKTTYASAFHNPTNLAFDPQGNMFVCENGYGGNASIISKTTPTGNRTTFASGLNNAEGLAVDAAGNLFEAETGVGIYKFTPAGTRTLFTNAVSAPRYLAFDSAGNLFVSTPNSQFISKVAPNGTVSQFASGIVANGIAFEPPLAQPLNISTRLNVQSGDNALIAGLIITGTAPKKLIIRALGPSLANFGITAPLLDPTLELHAPNGALISSNDNWKVNDLTGQSQQTVIQATGLAPTDDRESVLMAELAPGQFTAIVRGKNNTTGVAIVEVYDVNQAADSRLANISTRGVVGSGADVLIGGFIVGGGNGAAKLLIRALGPSLSHFGVTGALNDPTLSLRNANGVEIAADDDWYVIINGDDSRVRAIQNTGLAPSDDHESVILTTIPNGNTPQSSRGITAPLEWAWWRFTTSGSAERAVPTPPRTALLPRGFA